MYAALLPFDPGLVVHWLTLGLALLGTLAVGICVHELLHLVPLSFTDAEYTVSILPEIADAPKTADAPENDDIPETENRDSTAPSRWTALQNVVTGSLVRVEVTRVPDTTPDWVLRTAALLPILLALPLALVLVGVLPDPLAAEDHLATVALVALTGSGLPSPADWSVVWHGSEIGED